MIKESVKLYRHDVESWRGPYFVLYVDGHLLDPDNRESLRLGVAVGHYCTMSRMLTEPEKMGHYPDFKTFGCGLFIKDFEKPDMPLQISLEKIAKCRMIGCSAWLNRGSLSLEELFNPYSREFYDFVMSWCKHSHINVSETVVKLILSNWESQ